jgi:para-aminobenzoate synthetase component 1
MLNWANRFNICCFLDNNNYPSLPHSVECLLGAGARDLISAQAGDALQQLQQFSSEHQDWLFGHLAYDLKNETMGMQSSHPDHVGFPDLAFFVPDVVIELTKGEMRIGVFDGSASRVYDDINKTLPASASSAGSDAEIRQRLSRDEYLSIVRQLQKHILRGDCYEINFCQEFYAENVQLDPLAAFLRLTQSSPNPFAAYYKADGKYLVCASPERYLKKTGTLLISQPIKGTLRREGGASVDHKGIDQLYNSAKDRSENVMVVDLVRNDLSIICTEGSVKVDELFGIYTFPRVYQMISTISGELPPGTQLPAVIQNTFPMGSMTGAPKKRVLELIEKYEVSRRGLFSGALGYVTPDGDFDFNVVIRSLLYNSKTRYLSFPAGSGITFYSNPEAEYEECLLKVAAIREVLAFNR